MGIRETLNKNSGMTTGIAIAVLVAALGVLVWQYLGGSATAGANGEATGYYSDDDGKSFFTASLSKFPPFDNGGKQAVLAHIYTCDEGKTSFVGYLERYNDATVAKLRAAHEGGKMYEISSEVYASGSEVKKPGDAKWIAKSSPEAYKITGPACPPGTSGQITKVD